jgi:hypothetical protein
MKYFEWALVGLLLSTLIVLFIVGTQTLPYSVTTNSDGSLTLDNKWKAIPMGLTTLYMPIEPQNGGDK